MKRIILKQHKEALLAMLDMKIPIGIIAKAMGVHPSTMSGYYKALGKKDSEIKQKRTRKETQWQILAVYSSFLADPLTFKVVTSGVRYNILRIMEKELGIRELYFVVMAQLQFIHEQTGLSFESGISSNEERFIADSYERSIYFEEQSKRPKMEDARRIACELIIQLHEEKISFPTQEEFSSREDFYIRLTESLRIDAKMKTAPFITIKLLGTIKQQIESLRSITQYHLQSIEDLYELKWFPVDEESPINMDEKEKKMYASKVLAYVARFLVSPDRYSDTIVDILEAKNNLQKETERLTYVNMQLIAQNQVSTGDILSIEKAYKNKEKVFARNGGLYNSLVQPIDCLDLSIRVSNRIVSSIMRYLWEVVMWTPNDFLKFRSFGKKSLVELEHALSLQGLTFDMKFAKEEISFLIKMTYEKDGRSVPKHLLELLYG